MSEVPKGHEPGRKRGTFLSVVGIFLCVIFGFVLVYNLTIIIKSNLTPGEPPSVLGVTPLTVVSGSMSGEREGHLEIGDLIFVKEIEASQLQLGEVISFMADGAVTTHRIIDVIQSDGEVQFITKGDANNTNDQFPVSESQLVGLCVFRVPKAGEFALFLREPLGMVLFIILPLVLLILIEVMARRRETEQVGDPSDLELENARLRAMLEEQRRASATPESGATEEPLAAPRAAVEPVVKPPEKPAVEPIVEPTVEPIVEPRVEPIVEPPESPLPTEAKVEAPMEAILPAAVAPRAAETPTEEPPPKKLTDIEEILAYAREAQRQMDLRKELPY